MGANANAQTQASPPMPAGTVQGLPKVEHFDFHPVMEVSSQALLTGLSHCWRPVPTRLPIWHVINPSHYHAP